MAHKLRKVAGAKTDQIDAHLLAKMGRFDLEEMRRLEPDSPTVQELKTLTRDQDSLIQTQTRMPQPADGLPQGILSCSATLVYQIATALHPPVFAGVSHPTNGTGCIP